MAEKVKNASKRKSSQTLVVTDSPDDAERFDTGDASDFAGRSDGKEERPHPSAQKPRRK